MFLVCAESNVGDPKEKKSTMTLPGHLAQQSGGLHIVRHGLSCLFSSSVPSISSCFAVVTSVPSFPKKEPRRNRSHWTSLSVPQQLRQNPTDTGRTQENQTITTTNNNTSTTCNTQLASIAQQQSRPITMTSTPVQSSSSCKAPAVKDNAAQMTATRVHDYMALRDRMTVEEVRRTEVTYADYIETKTLLSLQESKVKGGVHHHDEHLFIVVHQGFELWFKQFLWELDSIRDIMMRVMKLDPPPSVVPAEGHIKDMSQFSQPDHPVVPAWQSNFDEVAANICVHRLRRMDQIMRFVLGQFDLLETMDPADFLEFRDYIGPASGFQSVQMREIECALGTLESTRIHLGGCHFTEPLQKTPQYVDIIARRLFDQYSLRHLVYSWLESLYDRVPEEFVDIFRKHKRENLLFQKSLWNMDEDDVLANVEKEMNEMEPFIDGTTPEHAHDCRSNEAKERRRRRRIPLLFIMCYRHQPELARWADFLDNIVAVEEALTLWRTRHARMVERMIGRRTGTGGSSGVEYLDKTTEYRIFTDLWMARSHFVRSSALPSLSLKPVSAPASPTA